MKKGDLLRKIKKEFPQLQWKTAKHYAKSWDHYVIILDNKYVFRFPYDKEYLNRIRYEIELLRFLQKRFKISIPKYEFVAKDKSFAGYQMLPGVELLPETFKKLSPNAKSKIAHQIAEFLTSLHRIPLKTVRKFQIEKVNTKQEYRQLVLDTKKYLFPRLSKKDIELIEEFFEEFKPYTKFPNLVLTHNDLHSDHVLFDKKKNRISAIIDFSDWFVYDPATDFLYLWMYGKDFVEQVYRRYRGPKDQDFLQRSQMYQKRMWLWDMISAIRDHEGSFRRAYKLFKQTF